MKFQVIPSYTAISVEIDTPIESDILKTLQREISFIFKLNYKAAGLVVAYFADISDRKDISSLRELVMQEVNARRQEVVDEAKGYFNLLEKKEEFSTSD